MAKVTGPLHSTEARGKVDALQYNTWRGLHVVKSIGQPQTQYSDPQKAARAVTAALAPAWEGLNEWTRDLWRVCAELYRQPDWTGSDRPLHAQAAFIKCNYHRLAYQFTYNDRPALLHEYRTLGGLTATPSPGEVAVEWNQSQWGEPSDLFVHGTIQGPYSIGRRPDITHRRFWAYCNFGEGLLNPGPLADGHYTVWLRTFSFSNDFYTPWETVTFDVVPE